MSQSSLAPIDSKDVDARTERKVRTAMSQLILDSPFFSVLLQQQKLIYTLDIPTMATDAVHLYINPIFINDLNKFELIGVLVHELYHILSLHMTRRGNRDPRLFNIACDYAINPMVKHDKFILPGDHLDEQEFHGMTADAIYNVLKDRYDDDEVPEELLNSYEDIIFQDHISEAEKTQIEQQTKINITKAMTAAGDKVPDSIRKLIHEAIDTKVDWKALLREFIQTSLGSDEATWKRPNRNFLHKDLYLPSYQGHTMPTITVMIDTSGSIYSQSDLFETFTGEINKIIADFSPEEVHIFYVDTDVKKHDTFSEGEEPTYEIVGGGGTNFISAWPEMEKTEPACIVAFTDCWASFPKDSAVDTLWITYENTDAHPPFGKVVYAEE